MAQLIPPTIKLSDAQAWQLISMADQASPNEICGILAGNFWIVDRILPITNISGSSSAYEMDPKEQIAAFYQLEQLKLDPIAFYHSHPLSPPYPSDTDLAEWTYPEIPYMIIGQEQDQWRILGFLRSGNDFLQIDVKLS